MANWSAASTSCASASSVAPALARSRPRARPRRRDDLRRRGKLPVERRRGRGHLVARTRLEVGRERAGRPEVLAVAEPARRLLARADVAVPGAAGLPAVSADAVGALEDEAAICRLDPRRAVRVALAVHAAPRAERRQLEPHRPVRGEQPVDDADRRRTVRHRELALEQDPADLPAPARHAVVEVERDEQLVAARVDGSVPPLVGGEAEARVARDEHRVERGEAEIAACPARRPRRRAGRGSAACAGRRPCPSRSRRRRRRRATRASPPRRACRTPAGRGGSSRLRSGLRRRHQLARASAPRRRARAGSARRRVPSSRSGGSRRAPRRCRRGSTR